MTDYSFEYTIIQPFLINSFISKKSEEGYENNNERFEDLFNKTFNDHFFSKENNIENENDEKLVDYRKFYSNSNLNESTKNKSSHLNKEIFVVINSSSNKSKNEKLTKKRGRKSLKDSNLINGKENIHDKNALDNSLRKVNVNYLNYLLAFSNNILKEFNYNYEFLDIDHTFKNNIKKEFFEQLKKKTLSEIICNNISDKYSKKDISTNRNIYEKIKENKILENIFKENFMVLFEFYFKNKRRINLKKYGIEKEIYLPEKIKTFQDLINRNLNNKEYIKNLRICIYKNYLQNTKFLIY